MPPDPDHEDAPEESEPAVDPEPPEPGEGAGGAHGRRTPQERIAAVHRQWLKTGRPSGDVILLVRATSGAPDGLPFFALLGVDGGAADDAWEEWDRAQLASDDTPIGRVLRPVVALVPFGGRWTAARSLGNDCIPEPIDHATPARALSAAATRWELVAARKVGDSSDDLAEDGDRDKPGADSGAG